MSSGAGAADDPTAAPRSAYALLRDRTFGSYFFGSLVGNAGTYVQNIVALLVIFDATRSALLAGAVTTLYFGMQLVLSPTAGSLADRLNRRGLALLGQAMGLCAALALTAAVWADQRSVPFIVAMVGLAGAGQAFTGPAVQAALPSLVPRPDLAQALALHSVTFNLSRAVGPAAGAALYTGWGPGAAFAVNALSYGIFMVVLLRLPFPDRARAAGQRGDVWGGVRYVGEHREIALWLLAIAVVGLAMEPVNTLGAPIAVLLGADLSFVGVIASAFGAGAVVMAFLVSRMRVSFGPERAALAGMGILGLGMLVFALSGSPAIAIGSLVVAGAGYMLAVSDLLATLQTDLPDQVRGRVMALWLMALLGCRPIAATVHGFLGDHLSPRVSTAAAAVLAAAVAGLIWRIRRPAWR